MITLYILNLENAEDVVFYQHLKELQLNIISTNIQNNIVLKTDVKEIKVTIHVPMDINPNIRRQKINIIYDILKPNTNHGGELHEKNNRNLCTAFC